MPTYSVYVSAKDAETIEKNKESNESTTQAFGKIISEKAIFYRTTISGNGNPVIPQYARQ